MCNESPDTVGIQKNTRAVKVSLTAAERKLKQQEYQRLYRQKHRDSLAEYNRNYRESHREEIAAHKRKYCKKHPDRRKKSLKAYDSSPRGRAKAKEFQETNRERLKAQRRQYYAANRELIKDRVREHRKKNPEKASVWFSEYRKKNRERINALNFEYRKKRRKEDLNYAISEKLSNRIRMALKSQKATKTSRSLQLLGCSLVVARTHIETQFSEGMSWANHGKRGWEIDHIRPLASFDLTDPEQQKIAFSYLNLQPLWESDNRKKSSKHGGELHRRKQFIASLNVDDY